ncbi:MAG: PD-(D/E)XK nuclease family protein, partial [Planctomycetes bacterium]|nr:PD-(D/E)XK nuclease family protein [Planctomycetota bacterium]
ERAEPGRPFSRLGRAQEEMLLFYEVLTRATESLTISYPALDAKAQHLPPSSYEIEVERTLGRENIQHADPRLSPVSTDSNPYSVAEWRIQAVARALDGDPTLLAGLSANTETQGVAASIDAGLRSICHRGKRDRFSPFEGLLESPAIRDTLARQFGPDHLWSPSQWESYAACPYRFFLESILQLEPLGELTLETDHARRGSLLHRVMASFHRCIRESLGASQPVSRHTREELKSKFDAALAAEIARLSPAGVDAALVELDRRQIEKWRDGYFDQIEKYDRQWADFTQPLTPAHFEVRFGPPRPGETDEDPRSTNQPFTLDIGGEEIRITGRIDRIDVGQIGGNTVFNIIDYKSGKRPTMNREHIESGERLQPPLYVMAAQAVLFDADNATPLWAGYWSMKTGVTRDARHSLQCSVDGVEPTEQWKALHPKIIARVRQFVADIRHGDFPVFSRDDQCTENCPFNTICRVNHIRSLNKTWPVETNSANTTP